MEKNDVIDLIEAIDVYYPGKLKLENPAQTVKIWHEALASYNTDTIKNNLKRHVLSSPFPPGISDLVKQDAARVVVPNLEETYKRIREQDAHAASVKAERTEAEKQEIERIQKGIRDMLGMGDSHDKQ